MKREDFKTIIKLRSIWKVDKRKGDYSLPNGTMLSAYLKQLVHGQMDLDHVGISEDGNLYDAVDKKISGETLPGYKIMKPFDGNEVCTFDEQEKRVNMLVREMLE